jgi:hypothetical protein
MILAFKNSFKKTFKSFFHVISNKKFEVKPILTTIILGWVMINDTRAQVSLYNIFKSVYLVLLFKPISSKPNYLIPFHYLYTDIKREIVKKN